MNKYIQQVLAEEFQLHQPSIKKINGYANANYLVKSNGKSYVLKTYAFEEDLYAELNAENSVLLTLSNNNQGLYPKPVPFKNGDHVKTLGQNGNTSIYRMLTFLEGQFLAEVTPNKKVYQSLGSTLAKMDLGLLKLKSYPIQARKLQWDLQYFHLNKKYLSSIKDAGNRNLVLYFFQQFERIVMPQIPHLRKQLIHNDANEWNILTTNNQVSGIIDFGDMAHSPLVNEIAIAMTYAGYDKEDPLEYASILLKAYHQINPILEKEISLLYYLIAARLCTSVCNSAFSKQQNPDNSYTAISEENAWITLKKWIGYSPIQVENDFRLAIGLSIKPTKSVEKVLTKRKKHISNILSISYKKPIQMHQAAFQYMYDSHGNTFLDAYNNIPHVGHSHPKVVAAGQQQMGRLNTNTRYIYDVLGDYAEMLLSKFPDNLNKVFFVNSGSAASDLAIRMAKHHTQRQHFMVMEHGYHGNTQLAIDISDYKFNNPKGQGQKENILKTPIPDTYRGKYRDSNAGMHYAIEATDKFQSEYRFIAGFISEPIVGCGGQIPLAPDYLKKLYPEIRKQGGLCISDEVQTGFGRLGNHFWGFEMHGVVPDMVILGKPMGNGHPLGAVVVTEEIAKSFEQGVEFFSSFGGNPVSCAIGMAVLDVIEEEELQKNAQEVGNYYKSLFQQLQTQHRCIGDVRGEGLFLGVDIVKEGTQQSDRKLAQHIKNYLRENHILISTDGPDDNVLKTKPPLCFSKENTEEVVAMMDKAITAFAK